MLVRREDTFMSASVASSTLVSSGTHAGGWCREGFGMNGLARLSHFVKWIAVSFAAVGVVLVVGLVLVALVAQTGSADTLNRWSSAGQAFGVLTAVFSGFALAALVITFG